MIAIEIEGVQRAANKSNFLAAVDAFYEKHLPRMAVALDPIVKVHRTLGAEILDAETMALAHVAASKEILLIAAECPAESLADNVAACVKQWAERASEFIPTTDKGE
jgi:hypothetical protein